MFSILIFIVTITFYSYFLEKEEEITYKVSITTFHYIESTP